MGYREDRQWSDDVMQPFAIHNHYGEMWPHCEILEPDKAQRGTLGHILDIAGADKIVRFKSGEVAFLGQRFRRNTQRQYDDLTIRYTRESGMKTEYEKIAGAVANHTLLAGYYAYGLANASNTGFERFRVIDFAEFVRRYILGRLPPPRVVANKDTPRTWFAYWPFDSIRDLIIREWLATPALPWWCDPKPGPCVYCGNTTYHDNERNSRYACDKCGMDTPEPKGIKFAAMPGVCRLDQGYGHDCYHHPKDKSKLVCRNCGEFVSVESKDTRRGEGAHGDTAPMPPIEYVAVPD